MKNLLYLILAIASSKAAFANDGGIAAIKVSEIKMREYEIKKNERVVKKKYTNPDFEITFKGSEARKLQKILPSSVSVITSMQPEIKKDYDESFKALGVYSEKSAGASSKIIVLNCDDANLVTEGEKVKIVKRKPEDAQCTLSIHATSPNTDPRDELGDAAEFNP